MVRKIAPGKPGSEPRWTSSQKTGVGTAPFTRSRIWFTLSHGIVNEVYFPNVDKPNTRDMQFLVTDGKTFFSEEKRDCKTECRNIKSGVAGYEIINTCKKKQYQIKKTVFCNPYSATLIQQVEFIPLVKKPLKLFVLLSPHIYGFGAHNTGLVDTYKGVEYLNAFRKHIHLVLGCSEPFKKLSCGYVGNSDGWTELKKNKCLKNTYTSARDGNIALTGEIDLKATQNKFTLALSFGTSFYEAAKEAKATFSHAIDHLLKKHIEGWEYVLKNKPKIPFLDSEAKELFDTSMMVLNTHLGKIVPGNVIASLSIPWGSIKGDNDLGGYHLIWPRDLVEIAGGFLASDDKETARLILHFLSSVQEADGHFAQCLWHTGKPYWSNIQMDETALPILLAGSLKRHSALKWFDPWPLVSKAVIYLVKNGPVTLQDRWEEDGGLTPFTLACEISALLVGADFFEEKGLTEAAEYIREVADYWNDNIENWTYVSNTKLAKKVGVEGYYVRITPDDTKEKSEKQIVEVKNRPPDHAFKPASEIVSTDALALVRFGLRSAKDPHILNTIKVIDHLLKKETKCGPVWKRYNEDGYGEDKSGNPFNGTGIGRGWPLLVGERAHYEVAKKDFKYAKELLKHLVSQSGENYLLPEQIWDAKDIPSKLLFNGRPTLGAMPLVWAHAEYLKLARSIQSKKVFDMPPQTKLRYQKKKTFSKYCIWKPNHKIKKIIKGKSLRIEVFEPCKINYRFDKRNQIGKSHSLTDSNLGIYYCDIPLEALEMHQEIHFHFPGHTKFSRRSFVIQLN
ncbi:MAG: Glucoamylase [Chlamydiae bacterium]|nr:Glucoamylase [Chlamydiota bacterium]